MKAFRAKTVGSLNIPFVSLLNKVESKSMTKSGDNWIAPEALLVACFINRRVSFDLKETLRELSSIAMLGMMKIIKMDQEFNISCLFVFQDNT